MADAATANPARAPRPPRGDVLPLSLAPIGLNREQAAAFVGFSVTLFDEMVEDKRMPKPRMGNSRVVWDVDELRIAFKRLPRQGGDNDDANEWDEVCASSSRTAPAKSS